MPADRRQTFLAWETPGRRGETTLLSSPLLVANRLRARERTLIVEEILSTASPGDAPRRVGLFDVKGCPLPDCLPIRIAAWSTFYSVAEFAAGDRIPFGDDFALVHPALEDLGTWFGSPGADASAYTPSPGPLCYVTTLRVRLGRAQPEDLRVSRIMALAAEGMTDRQIAASLGLSGHTVESHWRSLRERTGAASRTAAVANDLAARHRRAREDIESQRDRTAAESWIARRDAARGAVVRSWPRL